LTGIFPLLSAVLTPIAARGALWIVARGDVVRFDMWTSLALLIVTISLPLAVGVFVRHRAPTLGRGLLKPVEVISEAIGAASLAFVTVTQFGSIVNLGWQSWLAMALLSEISFGLGWQVGGPERGSRQVLALGTSNRNIALALLVAVQSFHGTEIASAVVGNGLLLIGFGLLHVAWWRFGGGGRRLA
jgi:BASS family bile acid:Na+ symporter